MSALKDFVNATIGFGFYLGAVTIAAYFGLARANRWMDEAVSPRWLGVTVGFVLYGIVTVSFLAAVFWLTNRRTKRLLEVLASTPNPTTTPAPKGEGRVNEVASSFAKIEAITPFLTRNVGIHAPSLVEDSHGWFTFSIRFRPGDQEAFRKAVGLPTTTPAPKGEARD